MEIPKKICRHCGAAVGEDERFCGNCGKKIIQPTVKKGKKKLVVILAIVLVAAVSITIGMLLAFQKVNKDKFQSMISLGAKYLQEMDFENAEIAFQNAINIEPKSIEPYIQLSEVYLQQDRYDDAENILEEALVHVTSREGIAAIEQQQTKVKNQQEQYNLQQEAEAANTADSQVTETTAKPTADGTAADSSDMEETTEDYMFDAATWSELSYAAAWTIVAMKEGSVADKLGRGEVVEAAEFGDEDMISLIKMYFSNGGYYYQYPAPISDTQNPPDTHNYLKEHMDLFLQSIIHVTPEGVLAQQDDRYFKYENGVYSWPQADGAPIYELNQISATKTGSEITAVTELICISNVETAPDGKYEVIFEEDADSLYGYYIKSVRKVEA